MTRSLQHPHALHLVKAGRGTVVRHGSLAFDFSRDASILDWSIAPSQAVPRAPSRGARTADLRHRLPRDFPGTRRRGC